MKTNNSELLELLHLFTAVRALHVSGDNANRPVLFRVLESATAEMAQFPALELLCLESPLMSVDEFITAQRLRLAGHRLAGHPITVVDTPREFNEILESHFQSAE